jgi:hypothetical protein
VFPELKDFCCISTILFYLVLTMNNNTELTSASQNVDGSLTNEPNLLQGPARAKPNPGRDPALQELIDVVTALSPRYGSLKNALKMYLLTDRPLDEIACEHSYTATALVYWIKKLGLPRRRRGRGVVLMPLPDQQHLPRAERRSPRSVIISFRITLNDWQLLVAAKPPSGDFRLSAYKKARLILLSHIAPPDGNGPEPTKASATPAQEVAYIATADAHNRDAA